MTRNLSIVIPHYQKHEALMETWKELMLQLHPKDQIVIVDDHSPDGLPDIHCPCTEIIQPPKHEPHIYRLCTLRNHGIQHAKHDACIILDPDCIPNPRFLDNTRKLYDPAILYGGWIDYLNEDGGLEKRDPRNSHYPKSSWVDREDSGCGLIWGGCMMFSKRRTGLVGWFNEEYNHNWGAEEHEFASRCWNSGIRLRYEEQLKVLHQWHPKIHYGAPELNRDMLKKHKVEHNTHLNMFTDYNPAVAILVVSTMRPYYIPQVMRGLFRETLPVKVMLVNNGDTSDRQRITMSFWKNRWAVDYVNHVKRAPLPEIRNHALKHYKNKGYRYLILQDDDILIKPGHLKRLIHVAEQHPEYYAVSGYITSKQGHMRQIGGFIRDNRHYYHLVEDNKLRPADYTSTGFTLVRLDKPVVSFTENWGMGWNDWDWSNKIREQGYKVATTGYAGAYHRLLHTTRGYVTVDDPPEYDAIRRNRDEHKMMAERFKEKWGYLPVNPRPETEHHP